MSLTYNGSTAGSTLANPPVLLAAAIGGHVQFANTGSTAAIAKLPTGALGAQFWYYASTNDPLTELVAQNTFGDGYALGMHPGDIVFCVKSTADSTAPFLGIGVAVTSAGATGFGLSSSLISSTAA
jgi:hypothetical protein